MYKKEFYKEIRVAINLAVNRFYTDLDFEGHEKLKEKTKRSLFYEYKKYYDGSEWS